MRALARQVVRGLTRLRASVGRGQSLARAAQSGDIWMPSEHLEYSDFAHEHGELRGLRGAKTAKTAPKKKAKNATKTVYRAMAPVKRLL